MTFPTNRVHSIQTDIYMNTITNSFAQYDEQWNKALIAFKIKHSITNSWRVLSGKSITEQLETKAVRIREMQEELNDDRKTIEELFIEILNLCIVGLIQINPSLEIPIEIDSDTSQKLYSFEQEKIRNLMIKKNHDYGEAWREMRMCSFVDLILSKIHRVKQIELNEGKTLISEGIDANYHDIANYANFALIKISEDLSVL